MTRKDYQLIANVFNGQTVVSAPENIVGCHKTLYLLGANDQKAVYAGALAEVLASNNPRFDRAKFLAACGITE